MKARILLMVVVMIQSSVFGQGTILFDTHVPGKVDSRWVLFPGTPPVDFADFGVALGVFNDQLGRLQWLTPTTTLKISPASEAGYVEPMVMTVPGISPGTKVGVYLEIFDLKNPSVPLDIEGSIPAFGGGITLGGGDLPPAYLTGFPAEMAFVPEPPSYALLAAGLIGIALTKGAHLRYNYRIHRPPRVAEMKNGRPRRGVDDSDR